MAEKPIIELVNELTEFNDMKAYMNDADLDYALDLIIKLIAKPDIPASTAHTLIVKLQAISAKLSMQARYYTTFLKGGENSKKKNTYYTAAEAAENENNDIAYRYFSRCSDNCSRIVHELEVAEAE